MIVARVTGMAMAGMARWRSAYGEGVQVSGKLVVVRKPVTVGGGMTMIGSRPPSGSHIQPIAKQSWRRRPRKKRGIEISADGDHLRRCPASGCARPRWQERADTNRRGDQHCG